MSYMWRIENQIYKLINGFVNEESRSQNWYGKVKYELELSVIALKGLHMKV